jgi:hypothetical protein
MLSRECVEEMETQFIDTCGDRLFDWPAVTMKRHFISRCDPDFPSIAILSLQTPSR